METPIKIYSDGSQRVLIFADRKERFGYFERDQWPTLHRATVPTLTDEQWYAAPIGEQWREVLQG